MSANCAQGCDQLCLTYAGAIGDPYPCEKSDEWKRSMLAQSNFLQWVDNVTELKAKERRTVEEVERGKW